MGSRRNLICTFLIGLVAGVAPFLFMQILPALLDASLQLGAPSTYLAIILTGVLIGLITMIIFAQTFDKRGPQDVFFYALGIPALLIATVSNIGTKYDKVRVEHTASESLLHGPSAVGIPKEKDLKELSSAVQGPQGFLVQAQAWAAEELHSSRVTVVQAQGSYLVIIGTYSTEKEARHALDVYRSTRLRTERYFPKDLRLFGRQGTFYVSYTGPLPKEGVDKLYGLLRINDPQLALKVVQME